MTDELRIPASKRTLRDEFAAAALTGLLREGEDSANTDLALAQRAYDIAEAMLQVRAE